MEQILQALQEIGVPREVLEAISAADDRERALILMMEDDRREYVD